MALSRRELLLKFGLSAASLPLLDVLGNRAHAQGMAPPRRLVSIIVRHGIFAQHLLPFVPTGMPIGTTSPGNLLKAPSDFLQPMPFEQRNGGTAIDLMPLGGALSPVFSAKWQALKRKTAFIHNLGCSNVHVQGHCGQAPLGGYLNGDLPNNGGPIMTGETMDVVIGRKLNGRLPLVLKCPDVFDDVRYLEDGTSISVKKNATGFEQIPSLRGPLMVWDRLFGSYGSPDLRPAKRDPNQRRVALLERTLQSVRRLERDGRLSAYDRQRLDQHAGLLEAQHAQLAAIAPPRVAPTAVPPVRPEDGVTASGAAFAPAKGELFRAQLRNAAAAVKMNKEQVISIDTALENEWVSDGIVMSSGYHGNGGHLANPSLAIIEECRKIQQLMFDAIADFVAELDVLEDPASGQTYLDNTLVLITPEHDGRPNGHLRASVPSLLVGGFGSFRGGKLYEYSVPSKRTADPSCIWESLSYSRLIYTVLDAFGVTAAERSTMDIQGVAQDWQGADLTGWNQPLPGLS